MKNILKQLEVLATNSKRNNFKAAVIRLTVYYSVGVFILLSIFSVLVYGLFAESINEEIQESESYIEYEEEFHSEAKENLLNILLISDLILIFVTIYVSYVLSKKTLEPLEIAYQKQKRFVADAAHELRTPLAVLKAGSEVLSQKERTLSEYKDFVQESGEEVERLIKLSNDLLFLVNNENPAKNNFETISFSELCTKECEFIAPYATLKQIHIHSEIAEGITIFGKKDDIVRLLLNLLKNTVDYNKTNGEVHVSLSKKENMALLLIRDTGIGIAQKDISLIFDRFYKADTSRTQSSSSGNGLGLAIVKDIVQQHKGLITASSTLGQGTTFEVQIPFI